MLKSFMALNSVAFKCNDDFNNKDFYAINFKGFNLE